MHFQPLQKSWMGLAVVILGLSVTVSLSKMKSWIKLLFIIILGAGLQFSIGFSKGDGFAGIRQNIENTGHAEFATVAVQPINMLDVAKNYESKVDSRELGNYAPSKPPGTVLFYMLFDRLANFKIKNLDTTQRLERLRTFTSFTWTILCYFVVIPMWLLGKSIIGEKGAITACLLYLSIPSVNLITMHLDQVLFPLLGIIPVLFITLSSIKPKPLLPILSGITFYIAIYISFSLLFVMIIMLIVLAVAFLRNPLKNWVITLRSLGAIIVSILLCDILLRVFLHYDIITRFLKASAYHENWKGWDYHIKTYLGAGITNMVEFSVWLGIPITVISLIVMCSSIYQFSTRKKMDLFSGLSISITLVFIALLVFGKTKAETARLWMFLIPYLCILVSGFIHNKTRLPNRLQFLLVGLILLLEFTTTMLTLHYQNFW